MSLGNQSIIKLVINESLPLVLSSNIESDFSDSSLAAVGSLIKLSFSTDTEIQIPSVLISDEIAIVTNTGGNNWESTYIMAGTEPDGVVRCVLPSGIVPTLLCVFFVLLSFFYVYSLISEMRR